VSRTLALVLAFCAVPAVAEEARTLDLRTLFAITATSYPEVGVAEAELGSAAAAESLARSLRRTPRLTLTGGFGVVPGARGTVFDSRDSPRDLDDFGPFWRSRLEFQMPLFTFGALAEAERAAAAGTGARRERVRARRDVGLLLAARAYFGWQLATRSLGVLEEVRGHLDEHLARLESEADQESDPLDLFRARNARFVLDRAEAEARRRLRVAEAGLRELTGSETRPLTDDLVALQRDATSLEEALASALAANPELREADLAADARAHLAQAARRERWPSLGVEGRLEYGEAPGRTRQDNPFVYDPFNVRSVSAAFGLRWDVNFKQSGARAAREEAEAAAARARRDGLRARIRIELAQLEARLVEALAVYETSRRALSTTANWLRVAEENNGLGTASTSDVIDSYTAYAQARAAHFEATYDLNLAIVGWRLAQGREPLAEGEAP